MFSAKCRVLNFIACGTTELTAPKLVTEFKQIVIKVHTMITVASNFVCFAIFCVASSWVSTATCISC